MPASPGILLWLWDSTNGVWRPALCDTSGKLIISDADPFEITQTTPEDLRHVLYGSDYGGTPTYYPIKVDSSGRVYFIQTVGELNDISDVNVPSPADGQGIEWDSATSKWILTNFIRHALLTTEGDLVVRGSSVPERLAVGSEGQVLEVVSGVPAWATRIQGYTEGAKAYNNADITIANATWTTVTLNSEVYDTDTMHSTVSNTERLTCNTAGKYVVVFLCNFDANATGDRGCRIYKNTSDLMATNSIMAVTTGGVGTSFLVATIVNLAATDYVWAKVLQRSGGNLDLKYGAYASPYLMAQRIG